MANGTSNSRMLTAIGTALLIAFLSFSTYRIYIYVPDCLSKIENEKASKHELKEVKTDIMEAFRQINQKLDALIMSHVNEGKK